MDKNFINIDLDDPKTGLVAEALSNKTCVKIISLLTEQELTAGDIAQKLNIPLNTTGYNLDKLIISGIIEKSSKFFWSVKGKKTPVYRLANKKIIISPKRSIKNFVPVAIISGLFAFILKVFMSDYSKMEVSNKVLGSSAEVANFVTDSSSNILNLGWVWFFVGALFSLIVASLWDWLSYRGILK